MGSTTPDSSIKCAIAQLFLSRYLIPFGRSGIRKCCLSVSGAARSPKGKRKKNGPDSPAKCDLQFNSRDNVAIFTFLCSVILCYFLP
jgi:hypothetical protein